MESNDRAGVVLEQPRTREARCDAARRFCADQNGTIPVLVDDLDDSVAEAYSAFPDRLYILDRRGRIAYKGGRGPFGFDPASLERALLLVLIEQAVREF